MSTMAEPRTIKVTPGSELARALEDAGDAPVLLENNGALYRLDRVDQGGDSLFDNYDPKAASRGSMPAREPGTTSTLKRPRRTSIALARKARDQLIVREVPGR